MLFPFLLPYFYDSPLFLDLHQVNFGMSLAASSFCKFVIQAKILSRNQLEFCAVIPVVLGYVQFGMYYFPV